MTQQVDREAALAEARARGDKAKKLLMEAIINIREAMRLGEESNSNDSVSLVYLAASALEQLDECVEFYCDLL